MNIQGNYDPDIKFKNPARPTYPECLTFFKASLKKTPYISASDTEGLENYWEYFFLSKNQSIVLTGEVCPSLVFICRGAIKHYTEDANGKYVFAFATKGYFCSVLHSFLYEAPSRDSMTCVDNTYGVKISLAKYQQLQEDRPGFKRLFHDLGEEGIFRMMNRLKSFQAYDARGRYELLMRENSSVFNHFTMQDISNYLGITPESLSRLRRDK